MLRIWLIWLARMLKLSSVAVIQGVRRTKVSASLDRAPSLPVGQDRLGALMCG